MLTAVLLSTLLLMIHSWAPRMGVGKRTLVTAHRSRRRTQFARERVLDFISDSLLLYLYLSRIVILLQACEPSPVNYNC